MSDDRWTWPEFCEKCGIEHCSDHKPGNVILVAVTDGGSAFHQTVKCNALIQGQRAVERRGGVPSEVRWIRRSRAISMGYIECQVCW